MELLSPDVLDCCEALLHEDLGHLGGIRGGSPHTLQLHRSMLLDDDLAEED